MQIKTNSIKTRSFAIRKRLLHTTIVPGSIETWLIRDLGDIINPYLCNQLSSVAGKPDIHCKNEFMKFGSYLKC